MDEFNLGRLTDFDFEILCKDILEEELSDRFEMFSPGPDGGVDLRHIKNEKGEIIVQCKHWIKSDRSKLIKEFEKSERGKVEKISPLRYIIMTSTGLTPASKTSLRRIMDPYIKSEADIWGAEDIVSFLRSHEDIIRRNPRLWLSGNSILRNIVNQDIFVRSVNLLHELEPTALTYVSNPSYSRSIDLLEKKNTCIISGIPGIGKTTLAQILALHYVKEGYELVEISRDAEEVNRAWNESSLQFFYYDDFLGQTSSLEKLDKNEDSRLVSVLRRIQRSTNKKMVLTTREYIMQQSAQRYEKLDRYNFEVFKCVIDLSDYSRLIKSEILYNHVYFSEITPLQKSAFADKGAYERITSHGNFNPRLVAASLTSTEIDESTPPAQIVDFVVNSLDSPENLWRHITENQISPSARRLLEVMVLVNISGIKNLVSKLYFAYLKQLNVHTEERDLRDSLQIMENTMISIHNTRGGSPRISYKNPSIREYMAASVFSESEVYRALCGTCTTFLQLRNLRLINQVEMERGNRSADNNSSLQLRAEVLLEDHFNGSRQWDRVLAWTEYLKIAEMTGSKKMAEKASALLEDKEFIQNAGDGDELVSLVRAVAESCWEFISNKKEEIRDAAVEWIMSDISDWNLAQSALNWIDALGDLAPANTAEVLHSELEDIATDGISEANSGHFVSNLDEMIDFLEGIYVNEHDFEGLHEAKSRYQDHLSNNPHATSWPYSNKLSDKREDSGAIEIMFDSLRNRPLA